MTSGPGEFAQPAWSQGQTNIAITGSGWLAATRARGGFSELTEVEPDGTVRDIGAAHPEYTALDHPAAAATHEKVAFIASSGLAVAARCGVRPRGWGAAPRCAGCPGSEDGA